jgi:magnesium transporter
MDTPQRDDVRRVSDLLDSGRKDDLLEFLHPLHPADIADILQEIADDHKVKLLKFLGTELAADVLTEIDEKSGESLLQLLTDHEVASLLEEMKSDDAADLVSRLDPEKKDRIKALLPSDDRARIHDLLGFEEDTAGGIMESEKLAVSERATVQDAIQLVRTQADEIENAQNVYVVSEDGVLRGAIRILNLLLHDPGEPVTEVMERNIVSVPVTMDQEEVAILFSRYDEFALPVVDTHDRLIGRITADDIIDVMEEEASEDITKLVGTDEDEIGERSPVRISRSRLPWLIGGLLGEVLNAVIISRYEVPIRTIVVLVFFIPLLIGTAGNMGSQAAVVVVRELALKEIDIRHTWRRILRELQVALINGLVLGALLFAVIVIWQRDIGLGALLCVSLLTVVLFAAFMGSSVPLILHRLKVDPAIATGPFVSVSNDIIGLAIYLTYATIYLSMIQ